MIQTSFAYGDKEIKLQFNLEEVLASRDVEFVVMEQTLKALAHLLDDSNKNRGRIIELETYIARLARERRISYEEARELFT